MRVNLIILGSFFAFLYGLCYNGTSIKGCRVHLKDARMKELNIK